MKKRILNKENLKLLTLIVLVVGYLFWSVVEEVTFIEFFYEKCVSVAWFLVGLYFVIEKDTAISRTFLAASVNNLFDEFFFDPYSFGVNEMIFGTILIFIAYNQHKRQLDARK